MDGPRARSVSEAQAQALARFRRGDAEILSLAVARGRILAADVVAPIDLPPFTNSAMDGYAVRAADTDGASIATPILLRVVGAMRAGDVSSPFVRPVEAIAITTGAPLPDGADAVVRLEETDGGAEMVAVSSVLRPGMNVRQQGEIIRSAMVALPGGARLSVGQIALLAALNVANPSVVRRPRIAVLSTGNELISVGTSATNEQIPDTNGPMLAALIEQFGGIAVPLGIARDTPDDLRRLLATVRNVDCVITSGGVSVGAYDAVRAVIAEQGALDFWQVRMKPGRPVAFGTVGDTPILALPGNPVAAFVAFHLFARPALARMLGQTPEIPATIPVRLIHPVEIRGDQQTYLRARLRATTTGWEADTTLDQGTGNIVSLAAAHALVVIPEGTTAMSAGEIVQAIPLDECET